MPSASDAKPLDHPFAAGAAARPGQEASFRAIAIWEVVKGVLVLLAGGVAFVFLTRDEEHAINRLVALFHLNPAGHTARIFVRAFENVDNPHLVLFALFVFLYVALRFVEAYGLWFQRPWGWIVGIVGAAIYLPFEVEHLVRRFTWPAVGVLAVNVAIVWLLWHFRTRHEPAPRG